LQASEGDRFSRATGKASASHFPFAGAVKNMAVIAAIFRAAESGRAADA
jgi:hypothetical protein